MRQHDQTLKVVCGAFWIITSGNKNCQATLIISIRLSR